MKLGWHRVGFVWLVLLAPASAQVVPPGFVASTIAFGAVPTGLARGSGGAFGADLYVSTNGAVKRVDLASGMVSPFATGLFIGAAQPSGVVFDSGAFGTGLMYVCQNGSNVVSIGSAGTVTPFSSAGTLFSCNDLVIAPVGSAYGARMFVANGNIGAGTISAVTSAGVNSLFAAVGQFSNAPLGLDFAPSGSGFGPDLYASIFSTGQLVKVSTSGTATPFVTGLGSTLDFAFSPNPSGPFGDYAYVTETGSDSVKRVAPDGTVTTFATTFSFGSTGFDGDLCFAPDGRTLFVGSNTNIIVIRTCSQSENYCTAKLNSLGCLPAMSSTGGASASASSGFVIQAANVRNQKSGLLFYGVSGRAAAPFQGGTLCVASQIKRTPGVSSGGNAAPANDCSGLYSLDMNAFAAGALGGSPLAALKTPGTVVDCQWWGRDPGFPAPNNTTLSNALEYRVCQ
jgi:hypothetical protein